MRQWGLERRLTMSTTYIKFDELKTQVPFENVLTMLGITDLKRGHDRLSGRCPVCKRDSFKFTPSKGLCNCFTAGCPAHGDQIALVAAVRGYTGKGAMQKAAEDIATHFGTVHSSPSGTTAPNSSPQPQAKKAPEAASAPLQPLSYLEATHESVQGVGVSPETAQAFGAGLAKKGIMSQVGGPRLAIPIHDRDGVLVAYCGRAVNEQQQPTVIFPRGFDPTAHVFNARRATESKDFADTRQLSLVRDPLQVLTAAENGVENVVAFLTEAISAQQLEQLAALMDETKCDSVELF
jgi:DNA primase